jgi:hypothetical protein
MDWTNWTWLANFLATVKYSAFLRKATRYNPTRGGMLNNIKVMARLHKCSTNTKQVHSTSALPQEFSGVPSAV